MGAEASQVAHGVSAGQQKPKYSKYQNQHVSQPNRLSGQIQAPKDFWNKLILFYKSWRMDDMRVLEASMVNNREWPSSSLTFSSPEFGSKVVEFKAKPFEKIFRMVLGSDIGLLGECWWSFPIGGHMFASNTGKLFIGIPLRITLNLAVMFLKRWWCFIV